MSTPLGRIVGTSIYAYQRVVRLTRVGRWPLTIGVRIIVRDGGERVLLVRHTYTPGWHFPGGAIDRRETAVDPPKLLGVYLSTVQLRSDHIVVFQAGEWRPIEGKTRALEIAEAGFFAMRDLPKGTTSGTRRRVAELLGEAAPGAAW
jgi:8-oxo-dGTP pyrophosphatase MutT (NUDIX family)